MSPLALVFLVLYGLFALATQILVVALYVRYNKLKARVTAAEKESARQAAALRHEIADLKRQVAAQRAASDKAPPAEHIPTPATVHETPPAPAKREIPPVVLPPPVTVPPPNPEAPPSSQFTRPATESTP